MLNVRLIFFVTGALLAILSALMLIPAAVDLYSGSSDWTAFFLSSFLTAFVGIGLALSNKGFTGDIQVRDAFVLTCLSWGAISVFAAMPLTFSEFRLSWADAVFEAVSGLTTTGSTVIIGLDHSPPGVLLWRALLEGLGGIGIIVFALAVLPLLKIGGMQLFRTESSEKSDNVMPHSGQLAFAIGAVFIFLSLLCALCLWAAGMTPFDAICHALGAVATGGFSNKDASLGYYNNPAFEAIIITFMLLGGMPFVLYIKALNGKASSLLKDVQVRTFLLIALGSSLALTMWLYFHENVSFLTALRHASFNAVSILTTTGFVSQDYGLWGGFAVVWFFFLSAFGGCTGSTTGGIKTFRFYLLWQIAWVQIVHLVQPHAVMQPRFNGKNVSDAVCYSVMGFVIFYGATFMFFSIALSALGLDFVTSLSAVTAALGNVGPGLGAIVGPAGTFAPLPDAAKWMLSFTMLLGRLEIFTILALFSPRFWRV
ncbi:MAG: TrkH family potassium uptake protein [Rickettsiales bacterium]